jgi:hypothetical protein
MSHLDDHDRYIEYLQTELLTPDWDMAFDAESWARWYAENSSRLRASTVGGFESGEAPVDSLERLAREFQPSTRFELYQTQGIFGPLLEKVKMGANAIGLKPIREVRIATSTDVSATPVARPSSGTHLLFVGLGTSSFCNYWAKTFTALARTVARLGPQERIESAEHLRAILKEDPSSVVLAARLALRYALAGTLLGFGEVLQPPDYYSYRLQLVAAMETFAVAHEYSHFVAEERIPQLQGRELESFCDELGLQISRNCTDQDDWLGFTGIGPLIFFRSMQLCEIVRDRLTELATRFPVLSKQGEGSNIHPLLEDRISAVKLLLVSHTLKDQREDVAKFVNEYDLFATELISMVSEAVKSPVTNEDQGSESKSG